MPSNIEIKARVEDLDALRRRVRTLTASSSQVLHQRDVFFPSRTGRLKLRFIGEDQGQLISYERPDGRDATRSNYRIFETDDPGGLERLLSSALGELVTVRKTREVFIIGQTRVHLDQVEQLGTFMELEVVLRPGQNPDEGRRIAAELMRALGVEEANLVAVAYADLLARETER